MTVEPAAVICHHSCEWETKLNGKQSLSDERRAQKHRGGRGGGKGESTADVAIVRAGRAGGSVRAKARAVTAAVGRRSPNIGTV